MGNIALPGPGQVLDIEIDDDRMYIWRHHDGFRFLRSEGGDLQGKFETIVASRDRMSEQELLDELAYEGVDDLYDHTIIREKAEVDGILRTYALVCEQAKKQDH